MVRHQFDDPGTGIREGHVDANRAWIAPGPGLLMANQAVGVKFDPGNRILEGHLAHDGGNKLPVPDA